MKTSSFFKLMGLFTSVMVVLLFAASLTFPRYISDGTVSGKRFVAAHQVEIIDHGSHSWRSVGDRWKLSLTAKGDTTWHFVTQADYNRMPVGSHQSFKTTNPWFDIAMMAALILSISALASLFVMHVEATSPARHTSGRAVAG